MQLVKEIKRFINEESANGEWGNIYMLIVIAIAAVVLIALIKPMFKNSQQIVQQNPVAQAQQAQGQPVT